MTPGALVKLDVSTFVYFDVDRPSARHMWVSEQSTALVIGLGTRRTAFGRLRNEMLLVCGDVLGWTSTFPWNVV